MTEDSRLSATNLRLAAAEILARRGYKPVSDPGQGIWPVSEVRLLEDEYAIVAIVAYDTWDDLKSTWSEAQAALVELMSRFVSRSDAKAWDGYLVLLTAGGVGVGDYAELRRIRYDTTRLRKLVVTGDDLRGLGDVERMLMSLLPFDEVEVSPPTAALEMLPELLERKGLPREATRALVAAFLKQEAIVEELHRYRSGQ